MSDVLVEELETLEILEVAVQGPPGPGDALAVELARIDANVSSRATAADVFAAR